MLSCLVELYRDLWWLVLSFIDLAIAQTIKLISFTVHIFSHFHQASNPIPLMSDCPYQTHPSFFRPLTRLIHRPFPRFFRSLIHRPFPRFFAQVQRQKPWTKQSTSTNRYQKPLPVEIYIYHSERTIGSIGSLSTSSHFRPPAITFRSTFDFLDFQDFHHHRSPLALPSFYYHHLTLLLNRTSYPGNSARLKRPSRERLPQPSEDHFFLLTERLPFSF
jgi:hypothetical protein